MAFSECIEVQETKIHLFHSSTTENGQMLRLSPTGRTQALLKWHLLLAFLRYIALPMFASLFLLGNFINDVQTLHDLIGPLRCNWGQQNRCSYRVSILCHFEHQTSFFTSSSRHQCYFVVFIQPLSMKWGGHHGYPMLYSQCQLL